MLNAHKQHQKVFGREALLFGQRKAQFGLPQLICALAACRVQTEYCLLVPLTIVVFFCWCFF